MLFHEGLNIHLMIVSVEIVCLNMVKAIAKNAFSYSKDDECKNLLKTKMHT